MAFKAFKFRMYPNKEQQVFFAKTFGCVRFVYNYYLEKRIKVYQENKSQFSYFDCSQDLTNLKKTSEYAFLKEVDSHALQCALKNLDNAYKKFFKGLSGFPNFKSKKSHKNSYTTVRLAHQKNIDLVNGHIKLPKVGLVKIKQHRQVPSNYKLKSVTVIQTPSGKYYISVLFEYENQVQQVKPANLIEINSNSKDNQAIQDIYKKAETKLKREQRKLSLIYIIHYLSIKRRRIFKISCIIH